MPIFGKQRGRVSEGGADADLGGGIIKQRIARAGEGKSSGSRSIILFRFQERAVFAYGFEKKNLAQLRQTNGKHFENRQMWCLVIAIWR